MNVWPENGTGRDGCRADDLWCNLAVSPIRQETGEPCTSSCNHGTSGNSCTPGHGRDCSGATGGGSGCSRATNATGGISGTCPGNPRQTTCPAIKATA
jgi:hypothetical protein